MMPLVFSVWQVLLNNFAVEMASFTGREIGILQSVREIPGFLAFTVIFVLMVLSEQTLAILSLGIMSAGVAITGFWPSAMPLYLTTVLMSVGFHYLETVNQSLTLQWLDKKKSAQFMGKVISVKAVSALLAYGVVWVLMEKFAVQYKQMYLLAGSFGVLATLVIWFTFPRFKKGETQHKKIVLKSRYWLYYALVFCSGARRQIFMVFAGFMMVQKFGYSVGDISLLFIVNYVINMAFGKKIGHFVSKVGERKALTVEYIGLILVFGGYAVVTNAHVAAGLYVVDHLLFAMAIARKTYFQKIADPKDLAASSGISFTIGHIAAVFIPFILGIVWLKSPFAVFMIGVGFAVTSLMLARLIPDNPAPGRETTLVVPHLQVA
ncbi:MFS transporter [Sansalvadorimonas verongulae]|nr:MFS transporter [Sansalvadorimonas verongulae]